jgi:hypothetical protein
MAQRGKHLVPIRQTNRRAEHAAGRRAINQETFNLSRPAGGGRAQLKQALAYDNKLISHFYHFGDRSFILHSVGPDDLGYVRFRPFGRVKS